MTETGGWRPIPEDLRSYRDNLRIAGFDLVRVSTWEATDRARRYSGHQPGDYEYTIYPIANIDEASGQVYLKGTPESSNFSSERNARSFVTSHLERHAPASFRREMAQWLREDNKWMDLGLLTIFVPHVALGFLGLFALGNRQEILEAKRRAELLPRLLEMPRFAQNKTDANTSGSAESRLKIK